MKNIAKSNLADFMPTQNMAQLAPTTKLIAELMDGAAYTLHVPKGPLNSQPGLQASIQGVYNQAEPSKISNLLKLAPDSGRSKLMYVMLMQMQQMHYKQQIDPEASKALMNAFESGLLNAEELHHLAFEQDSIDNYIVPDPVARKAAVAQDVATSGKNTEEQVVKEKPLPGSVEFKEVMQRVFAMEENQKIAAKEHVKMLLGEALPTNFSDFSVPVAPVDIGAAIADIGLDLISSGGTANIA